MKIYQLIFLSLLITNSPQVSNANTIDFLFGAGSFGRKASPIGDCRNIVQRIIDNRKFTKDTTWKNRIVSERNPNLLSDLEFLEESRYQTEKLGVVDSRFSKEFDTRIYFTSTAKPKLDGSIPMVDPEAKALVIYFHGSGTSKASGANFAGKMNSLAKLGYTSIGFDLPFHADGSRNPELADAKKFSEYVNRLVNSLKVPGQPVILVGHSFGPDVMAEFITRYPFGADSLVMLSPGGFNKETSKWFENKTINMTKTFGEVEANNEGGKWAGMVSNGRIWSNPKAFGRVDPTIANPKLKIYVISGAKEEYIPGELDKEGLPTDKPRDYDLKGVFKSYFRNAEVTIEPGVGHYIFAHTDNLGQDVVLRSILKANEESLLNEKEIKKDWAAKNIRSMVDQLANKYSKDLFFKSWMDNEAFKKNKTAKQIIATFMQNKDNKSAQNTIKSYEDFIRQRNAALNANIKSTEEWAPDFYNANKAAIDKLGTKGTDATTIQSKYLAFLRTQSEEVLAAHAMTTEHFYEPQVKLTP